MLTNPHTKIPSLPSCYNVVHYTMCSRAYVKLAHWWISMQLFTVLLRVEGVAFNPMLWEVD